MRQKCFILINRAEYVICGLDHGDWGKYLRDGHLIELAQCAEGYLTTTLFTEIVINAC